MKNVLLFVGFFLSTLVTGTGIEKNIPELMISGIVFIVFSIGLLLVESAEEVKNHK